MESDRESRPDGTGGGGVRPLEPYTPESGVPVAVAAGRSRRKMALAAGAAVAVLVAGVAGAAWIRNQFGTATGAAAGVPSDADLVLTIDFLHFIEDDRLASVADALTRPLVDVGTIENGDLDSLIDELDSQLMSETGLSLREDVVPWVGRTASVSVLDLSALSRLAREVPALSGSEGADQPGGVLFTVEVKDRQKAEAFLQKAADRMEGDGASVSTSTIEGNTVYEMTGSRDTFYYSLLPDMLVVASDETTLRDSFAARDGKSILDSDDFQKATATLDPDRGWTLFVANVFPAMFEDALGGDDVPVETDVLGDVRSSLESIVGFTGAGGLLDDGAWAEFNVVFDGDVPAGWDVSAPPSVDTLPAGTLFYLAGQADPEAFDDLLGEVRDVIESTGIALGPYGDVLGYLDGGFTLGVVPAKSGLISSSLGADVGLLLAAGLEDSVGMRAFVDGLLGDFVGGGGLEAAVDGDVTRIFADGAEILAYAITEDELVVGTSGATLGPVLDGEGEAVTSGDLYRDLDARLPGEGVMVYADVTAILEALASDDVETQRQAAPFRAVRGFGASSAVVGSSASVRVVVLLDT